jgi:hypothetical protein
MPPLAAESKSAVARVVPQPAWRFGLRALLGLMAVCCVQFAAMNYFGVLGGLVAGMFVCIVLFGAIFLVGMSLTGARASLLPQLDAIIVRLMVALVVLVVGSIMAGGGTAAWYVLARWQIERIVEQKLGMAFQKAPLNRNNQHVWGLHITSVEDGGVAHQAGLKIDEVIVVEGTVEEYVKLLYDNRGKQVDVNVATGALMQSVQNCPQRSVTLPIPP